jgi:23S rRNA (adenine2503-C2)-methyltransferase
MKIIKNIKVPTGNILVAEGKYGKLEFLSIGDYGKEKNIKADFLNLTNDINGVPNGDIMPLTEKWVITISTQYGCSMGCKFCDVPKVGRGRNATLDDLKDQVNLALSLHPEITHTKRLNIHYARMGEPTFNSNVIFHAEMIKGLLEGSLVHPVVSTMMPRDNRLLVSFLDAWIGLKNDAYKGDAGLQLSINSTNEEQRQDMFSGNALSLVDIADIMDLMPDPVGRKYTLNFALADDYEIDAEALAKLFDPSRFMCKITPLHRTSSCDTNGIVTTGGYDEFTPYKEVENNLKKWGFDVIVFIPSYDEDLGLITCGNAVLSGNMPKVNYEIINTI